MSVSNPTAALLARVASLYEELSNAMTATYEPGTSTTSSKDNVQRLATAREQLLEACTQLRDHLMRLKQAALLSPQQMEDLLQHPQGAPKPPSQTPTEDSMDVDQQQEQPSSSAPEVAAAIMQHHAQFLSKLTSGPS